MTSHFAVASEDHAASVADPKGLSWAASNGSRLLMGLLFLLTGLNGLLQFLPKPDADSMPAGALALMSAFAGSGYLLPLIGATQATAGALLLANRFVPLALAILAPVIVNIVAFHLVLAPQGLPLAAVVLALELHLAVAHGKAFRSLLAARA